MQSGAKNRPDKQARRHGWRRAFHVNAVITKDTVFVLESFVDDKIKPGKSEKTRSSNSSSSSSGGGGDGGMVRVTLMNDTRQSSRNERSKQQAGRRSRAMQPKTDAAQVHWTVVVMCTAASWLQSAPSRDTDRPRTRAMQSSTSCSAFGRRRQATEPAIGSRLADFYVYEQVCI